MQIFHNPRCSKSRQTLDIIRDGGIEPEIIAYLETPPSAETLRNILGMLGIGARDLARKKESADAGIDLKTASDDEIIDAMTTNPTMIERPIVIADGKAVLGRPPENVRALL